MSLNRINFPVEVVTVVVRMNNGQEFEVRDWYAQDAGEQSIALSLKGTTRQVVYRPSDSQSLTADDRVAIEALHAALDEGGDPEYWGYQLIEARERILALLARIEAG